MSRCIAKHGGGISAGKMAGPNTIRIELRAAVPVAVLALVVLAIILMQLCGTEDVKPLGDITPLPPATRGPTFTPGPSPTRGPEEATATQVAQAGGAERDLVRVNHLLLIQGALAQYREEHDSYPETGGSIQTLCVFREFDEGCELEEFLRPLPEEPLGDAATNGYWYSSDGTTYVVYAQREADDAPECSEHPDHLGDFDSVMCVRSP